MSRPTLLALPLALALATTAAAFPGATTPAFILKWGNSGTAVGQFNGPVGIGVDVYGNVYVTDSGNRRVQKFDRLGDLMTTWGSAGAGAGSFSDLGGMVVSAAGYVYVADYGNNRIQVFDTNGSYMFQWGSFGGGSGQFYHPSGLALDASGNVYVSETGNNRVQKFSSTGAYITQWGGTGSGPGQFNLPFSVAVDASGYVFVADYLNHRVQKFSGTGTFVAQWGTLGTSDGQFQYPYGVAADAFGSVYVADYSNHRIQKFTNTGTFVTKWGSVGSGDGQFTYPGHLTVDASGDIFVADQSNQRIQRFSNTALPVSHGALTYTAKWGYQGAGAGQFFHPAGIAIGYAGDIVVADTWNQRMQRFNGTGGFLNAWGAYGGGNGQFNYPHDVAIRPGTGEIFVADTYNHRIQRFDYVGNYSGQWGTLGTGDGQLDTPMGIAIDPAQNIVVADTYNNRIQKFNSAGAFLSKWGTAGSGPGQFNQPQDVAVDGFGNVYVTDAHNYRVQKFSSTGAYITEWGATLTQPASISVDPSGIVRVSEAYWSNIQSFTSNGLYLGTSPLYGNGDGLVNFPEGMTTDAAGNVYIADTGNDRIQRFATAPEVAYVTDVRNDQGHQVRMRFLRSSADVAGSATPVLRYDVFRAIDPYAAPPAAASPASVELAGWEQVGSVSAFGDGEYNVVAPTLINSSASGQQYSSFLVRAATASPTTFFQSGTGYGYSVDNLSPPAPAPFAGAYLVGATHLHWGASTASDFASFKLYRGASADFAPDPSNLIAAVTDTGYTDAGPAARYYKLSAVDFDGNESPYALVGPGQTLAVDGAAPLAFTLEAMTPNPVRGRDLVVRFALSTPGTARIELVDVAGRRVAGRTLASVGAGRYAVALGREARLAPGVYVVRLTQGADTMVRRAVVLD